MTVDSPIAEEPEPELKRPRRLRVSDATTVESRSSIDEPKSSISQYFAARSSSISVNTDVTEGDVSSEEEGQDRAPKKRGRLSSSSASGGTTQKISLKLRQRSVWTSLL